MARRQASVGGVIAIGTLAAVKIFVLSNHSSSSSSSYDYSKDIPDYGSGYTPPNPTDPTDPNKLYEVSDVNPEFPGFDSGATESKLNGVWIAGADVVSISGSTMTRQGDAVNYTDAPITVHTPCGFSVEHDGKAFEASFALVPEGVRFDQYDGAILGTEKVVCDGPELYVITGSGCAHWGALEQDSWTQETSTCSSDTEADGTLKVTPASGDPLFLRPLGTVLVPVDSDDSPPVRYKSVAEAQKVVDAEKAIEKKMIAQSATPADLSEAVAGSMVDSNGISVKLKAVVKDVDPDGSTVTLGNSKDGDDDETVTCAFAKMPKVKVGQAVTVKGTISDPGDGTVALESCKLGH